MNETFLGNLYSHPGAFGEYGDNDQGIINGFPNWSMTDPLSAKVDDLVQYCFPRGFDTSDMAAELVRSCLTADNIKHLAEQFISFQGHWPILHTATFKITEAEDSLVMAIVCIGAIYSPRLNNSQTQQMMEFIRTRIFETSSIYRRTMEERQKVLVATLLTSKSFKR